MNSEHIIAFSSSCSFLCNQEWKDILYGSHQPEVKWELPAHTSDISKYELCKQINLKCYRYRGNKECYGGMLLMKWWLIVIYWNEHLGVLFNKIFVRNHAVFEKKLGTYIGKASIPIILSFLLMNSIISVCYFIYCESYKTSNYQLYIRHNFRSKKNLSSSMFQKSRPLPCHFHSSSLVSLHRFKPQDLRRKCSDWKFDHGWRHIWSGPGRRETKMAAPKSSRRNRRPTILLLLTM